jgi:hypothetical protein
MACVRNRPHNRRKGDEIRVYSFPVPLREINLILVRNTAHETTGNIPSVKTGKQNRRIAFSNMSQHAPDAPLSGIRRRFEVIQMSCLPARGEQKTCSTGTPCTA